MTRPGTTPRLWLASAVLVLLVAGCNREPTEDPATEDAGLLEPQRQALERARGVEDDLAEAARRKQDRIDEEQDGTPRD